MFLSLSSNRHLHSWNVREVGKLHVAIVPTSTTLQVSEEAGKLRQRSLKTITASTFRAPPRVNYGMKKPS